MAISANPITIDHALDRFLAEQRERLSEKTFRRYQDVVQLLRHSLDGYAYTWLEKNERQRWEAEVEVREEGAFCRLFGPEKIPGHLGEFLSDFMVRKVFASQELLKASGTVTGKLMCWLSQHGYIDDQSAQDASDQAREASRDLPTADRLGMMLHDVAADAPDLDPEQIADQDWVEDSLQITNVEPGRIWFDGGVGPISVPRKASDLARPGWSVYITAARSAGTWHLLEVGFVYP
ncbi:MAG: hypothetical protein ACLP8S_17665 [Solirubrobacteraceae bacterium]